MDKKQKISWGVSFGSVALVAGMVSYLGLANGDKADNQTVWNQGQPSTNHSNQQSQDDFNFQPQERNQGFHHSFGRDRSSQFNQNDQDSTTSFNDSNDFSDNNDQFFDNSSQQDSFSNGGGPEMGHHGGFDTTTGGT